MSAHHPFSTTFAVMAGFGFLLSSQSRAVAVDPITRWSTEAATAASAAGMAPLRTPITFAILHVAMYDAVNAVGGNGDPYAVSPTVMRPASAEAAAVEAGYRILLAELPSQQASLDLVYRQLLTHVPHSEARQNGLRVGADVARQLLANRANDGRNAVIPHVPGSGPGVWVPTPPGFLVVSTAFLARVTPFTMDRPSQFRPAGPPAFDSDTWARDFNEVKLLGAQTGSTRSAEQTATAWFWEPLAGTVWPASIRRLATEQTLDLESSARFQAAAFAAFADGLVACWDAKFAFSTWRPVTAIRAGDTDGNALTEPDSGWLPLAITPNFPEYPSGHACATAAVAHTIEQFLPHEVSIPVRHAVSGEERLFRRASDVVQEVVDARMLLGVHYRFANEDGADIGRKVARQIHARWFARR
jgi:hypothetical protein